MTRSGQKWRGGRHDILIAIGSYEREEITSIPCCENDVEMLGEALAKVPASSGDSPRQTVITSREGPGVVSKTALLTALEDALSVVERDDSILLTVSCHGAVANGRNYLLPGDARGGDLDSWIPFDWVKTLLDDVDCKFKILLIDACHSGDQGATFKRTGFDLGLDDESAVRNLLLSSSGLAYGSACGHDEVAYVEPDGRYSVWLHTLGERLGQLRNETAGELILVEDLLPDAALRTSDFVARHLSRKQTPFYIVKANGLVPLGLTTGSPRTTVKEEPTDVAELTLQVFEHRFQSAFDTRVPVEFDRRAQENLAGAGQPLTRVLNVGSRRSRVRLAVSFDPMPGPPLGLEELVAYQQAAANQSIDRIILARSAWPSQLRRSAAMLDRLHLLDLAKAGAGSTQLFRDFYMVEGRAEGEAITANEYSDAILTEMGKLFHIVLADLAAPRYDEDYARATFGTERAMAFEEEILGGVLARAESTELAVDLGCGTGRHTFMIGRSFDRVVGSDFSPKMIEIAEGKKRELQVSGRNTGNVEFEVRDVEMEPLDLPSESLDLAVGCFGMGSFISDLVPFLAGIKEQLRPGGTLILSFYNAEALVYQSPPPWRDAALSATLVPGRDELEVRLPTGETFHIFCKPYTYALLKGQLSRIFDSVKIQSCPAFASFLPSDYFSPDRPSSDTARRVISDVDRDLARRTSLPIGAYFTAVCSKQANRKISHPTSSADQVFVTHGEGALISVLEEKGVKYEVLKHGRVRNIDDVRRELGVEADVLVKAILAVVRGDRKERAVLVVQGSRRVDIEKVSSAFGRSARKWRFATQKEVRDVYGLEIGGVPPFGYDSDVPVYLDNQLLSQPEVICGVGNPQRSLKLATKDLLAVSGATVCDIASR